MRVGKASGHLVLTSDAKGITRAAGSQWVKALNQRIRQGVPEMTQAIREKVADSVMSSYEVTTILASSELIGQLGITEPTKRFKAIADAVAQSVIVIVRPFRIAGAGRINGSVIVYAAPRDVSYLLELPEAWSGWTWLEALLTGGDATIQGYAYRSYSLSAETLAKYSRTGQGLMVRAAGGGGRGWSMPVDISGTEDHNLVTRCLDSREMDTFIRRQFELLLR